MHIITRRLAADSLPVRTISAHKGSFGRVLVVAGSRTMCGAGYLCAKSALVSGAGLVYWALPQTLQPAFAAALPEAITLPLPETSGGEIAASAWKTLSLWMGKIRPSVLVVGPGMGNSPLLPRLLQETDLPSVWDAGALDVLARMQRFRSSKPVIITPHPGEAARLLHVPVAMDVTSRVQHATQLADQLNGGVCVLKGHDTLVAVCRDKKTEIWRNTTGGPALAKGGSGDVLAGLLAGLWAQLGTAEGFTTDTAVKACVSGVYIHGLAGDLAAQGRSSYSVLASHTIEHIGPAVRQIQGGKK